MVLNPCQSLLDAVKWYRRVNNVTVQSVYATAKESGLRPDVVLRVENEPVAKGSAAALIAYIDSFCKAYPDLCAYILQQMIKRK